MSGRIIDTYDLDNMKQQPIAELAAFSRKVAADGCVLLKNDNGVLPFKQGERVSVFGRIQLDYYKSGTGSGGLVNSPYVTNIIDGLRNNGKVRVNEKLASVYADWAAENPFDKGAGWAQEPWCQKEMPLDDETVRLAAEESDVALIIIGRTAGEDQDNYAGEGSYLLTEAELDMVRKVSSAFDKVAVVLNVGNIIDEKFADEYNIDSLLYVWQGGMEGGNAAADVLCGDVSPSGKLADTVAYDISQYPSDENFGGREENKYAEDIYVGYRYFETVAKDSVKYPFGFGLSYTVFDVVTDSVTLSDGQITASVTVKNIGNAAGKEVVQVYFEAPQGKLGKPLRQLIAFKKTKELKPCESETLTISFGVSGMASYDDSGVTGYRAAYVLEEGEYKVYIGTDVRYAEYKYSYNQDKTVVTEQLVPALMPTVSFDRMKPQKSADGGYEMVFEPVPTRDYDLCARIDSARPESIEYTGDKGYKLIDVKNGKCTMEQFIAQLSNNDLKVLVYGEGMSSPKVTPGTGCAFGGLTPELQHFGIPIACGTDGPSGLRLDSGAKASSLPNGTLIACTFDPDLVEQAFVYEGLELQAYDVDCLLGPGINIHRHPLNGRNFEYFSEDPLLTGKMAAAICRGIAKSGNTAVIKHFITNNQETCRHSVNSVVSERAVREIYARAFEIAVKEGGVRSIMTSYNPINGIWSAGNYDLNTELLRNEWGYDGFVMTDWWAKMNEDGEPESVENIRAMLRAQNDIYMVTGDAQSRTDNLHESLESGALSLGELQRSVKNMLSFLMNSQSFERFLKTGGVDLNKLMLSDEGKKPLLSLENPDMAQEYRFTSNEKGSHIVAAVLKSDAQSLAQMTVRVFIDDKCKLTLAINGTAGKEIKFVRDLWITEGDHTVTFKYDEEMVDVVSFAIKK